MTKRVMAAAFALALLGGASALAQPVDNHEHKPGGQPHGGPAPGGQPHGGPAPGVGGPHPAGPGGGPAPGGQHGPVNGQGGLRTYTGPNPYQGGQHTYVGPTGAPNGGPTGGPIGQHGYQGGPNGQRGYQGGPNGGPNGGGWHGGGPGFHPGAGGYHPGFGAPGFAPGGQRPHYNPQYFPHTFYPEQRFHWRGEWAPPPGFYYRHWNYGDRLPWGWYADQFWIDDYYDYDLAVPPDGYEWIRMGPDAVLVDLSSGMVVETVYGAFY